MRSFALAAVAAASFLSTAATPAPSETIVHLTGVGDEPTLLVRHEPGPGPSVLFVHGSSFPSGLSVAYKIDGRSWMDDLHDNGLDVWAFDFAGYGGSTRPAVMLDPSPSALPYGRADTAERQIERVATYVLRTTGHTELSILAHSWGTLPAGMFAARRPQEVRRLVLFGPVALRTGGPRAAANGASIQVTEADQWDNFRSGLPKGQAPLIAPAAFRDWASAYLATDPKSAMSTPPSVRVPSGPLADFADARAGSFPYDPAGVRAPVLVVRGEWDAIVTDADVAWLRKALSGACQVTDIKLPRGTHRMHLEENRQALFDVVSAFLLGQGDIRSCTRP